MRALAVLYEEAGADDQTKLVAALDALYTATWVERRATHKGDVLRGVLGGVFGEGEAERGMALFYFLIFSWGHHRSPSALMWCILSPFTAIYTSIHPLHHDSPPPETETNTTPPSPLHSPPSLDNNSRQGLPPQADRRRVRRRRVWAPVDGVHQPKDGRNRRLLGRRPPRAGRAVSGLACAQDGGGQGGVEGFVVEISRCNSQASTDSWFWLAMGGCNSLLKWSLS